jgi:hypothetical protein
VLQGAYAAAYAREKNKYKSMKETGKNLKPVPTGTHRQGLTLVLCSAQPNTFLSHLPLSPCLIDWGEIIHPTIPQKVLTSAETWTSVSPCRPAAARAGP